MYGILLTLCSILSPSSVAVIKILLLAFLEDILSMGINVMGEHKWAQLYYFCTGMSVSPSNLLNRSDSFCSEAIASKRGISKCRLHSEDLQNSSVAAGWLKSAFHCLLCKCVILKSIWVLPHVLINQFIDCCVMKTA